MEKESIIETLISLGFKEADKDNKSFYLEVKDAKEIIEYFNGKIWRVFIK